MGSRSDGQPSPPLDAAECLLASSRPRMAGADSKWVNSPSDRGHETNLKGRLGDPVLELITPQLRAADQTWTTGAGRRAHCACGCRVAPPEILSPAAMLQPPVFSWPPPSWALMSRRNIRSRDVPCAVCERIGRALHVMRPASELGLAPNKRSEVCRAVPKKGGNDVGF